MDTYIIVWDEQGNTIKKKYLDWNDIPSDDIKGKFSLKREIVGENHQLMSSSVDEYLVLGENQEWYRKLANVE
jgi:hypothetical protein